MSILTPKATFFAHYCVNFYTFHKDVEVRVYGLSEDSLSVYERRLILSLSSAYPRLYCTGIAQELYGNCTGRIRETSTHAGAEQMLFRQVGNHNTQKGNNSGNSAFVVSIRYPQLSAGHREQNIEACRKLVGSEQSMQMFCTKQGRYLDMSKKSSNFAGEMRGF